MSVYAVSDLHGNLNVWEGVKNILKAEDTLIFLGDAADRGEDGIQIILDLLRRPNTIYIKGNHEDFLKKAFKKKDNKYIGDCDLLWSYNGGISTAEAFMKLSFEEQDFIISSLQKMPMYYIYNNEEGKEIICSHSGNIHSFWDREHIGQNQKLPKNTISVHGHTPIQTITHNKEIIEMPLWYNNNQKCDIDCGTFVTNMSILLNLDTFESIIIKG